MSEELTIGALTPETWDAFAALVERHNGIFGGCWCIYFHPDCAERGQGYEGNRALKRTLVDKGEAHAALAFDGDRAVAWCEFGTPEELPNIHHRKAYEARGDPLPDYRLTCLFIDKEYRRRGISPRVLQGALDLIAQARERRRRRNRGMAALGTDQRESASPETALLRLCHRST